MKSHKLRDPRAEKIRDMVRGILPSTGRRAARSRKRIEVRRVRRKVRHAVRVCDHENPPAELDLEPDHRWTVLDRRLRDKINPFIRWANATTKGMEPGEALSRIRGILPDTLIGRHAYGHWETDVRYRKRKHRAPSEDDLAKRCFDDARSTLLRALLQDPTIHGRINDAIKKQCNLPGPPFTPRCCRLLAGIHDVAPFLLAHLMHRRGPFFALTFELESAWTLTGLPEIGRAFGFRMGCIHTKSGYPTPSSFSRQRDTLP